MDLIAVNIFYFYGVQMTLWSLLNRVTKDCATKKFSENFLFEHETEQASYTLESLSQMESMSFLLLGVVVFVYLTSLGKYWQNIQELIRMTEQDLID